MKQKTFNQQGTGYNNNRPHQPNGGSKYNLSGIGNNAMSAQVKAIRSSNERIQELLLEEGKNRDTCPHEFRGNNIKCIGQTKEGISVYRCEDCKKEILAVSSTPDEVATEIDSIANKIDLLRMLCDDLTLDQNAALTQALVALKLLPAAWDAYVLPKLKSNTYNYNKTGVGSFANAPINRGNGLNSQMDNNQQTGNQSGNWLDSKIQQAMNSGTQQGYSNNNAKRALSLPAL